jgi:hypothetical protein
MYANVYNEKQSASTPDKKMKNAFIIPSDKREDEKDCH